MTTAAEKAAEEHVASPEVKALIHDLTLRTPLGPGIYRNMIQAAFIAGHESGYSAGWQEACEQMLEKFDEEIAKHERNA